MSGFGFVLNAVSSGSKGAAGGEVVQVVSCVAYLTYVRLKGFISGVAIVRGWSVSE